MEFHNAPTNDENTFSRANFQKMFVEALENSDFSCRYVCSICATTQNQVQTFQVAIDSPYLSPVTDQLTKKLKVFKRSIKFWGREVELNVCDLCNKHLSNGNCPPLAYKHKYFPTKIAQENYKI